MNTYRYPGLRLPSLLLCIGVVGLGCAAERAPIHRLQENEIEKTALAGEWYYQRTVVDVPASNGFTHVGRTDYNGLSRVTFDIQQDTLYVRRATEFIKGADDKVQQEADYAGEVIAAFAIQKHFDIVNAYNPTTGEPLNIVEENDKDRPWYERAYMRVDWSENKVTNYNLDFERVTIESVPYYVQDTAGSEGDKHVDAPHFAQDGGYLDVTSRIFAEASTIDVPWFGKVPLCWLRGEEFTECGAGEYGIRHSFLRRDPERQYEPRPYKGKATEVFGFFANDRLVYDQRDGIREQHRERYLNRFNLWKRWNNDQGQPIPYAERELRQVVYHVNRDFPDDLKPIARNVADQWNEALSAAVKALGHQPQGRVFVLCENNPVQDGDPAECGEAGTSPRIGDIRYSMMAYVPKYMTYGLLGLGPSNADPETGEILSGMAYVYHHNNLASNNTLEMLQLLNGTKAADAYIDGVDLGEWLERTTGAKEQPARTFDLAQADHMVDRIANGWRAQYWARDRQAPSAEDVAQQKHRGFGKWVAPHLEQLYQRGIGNGERHAPEARLAQLQNSYIEQLMLDPEVLLAGGHAPNTPVTDAQRRAASVARGGMGRLMKERARLRQEFAAARNMYLPEMADDALIGLARELKGVDEEQAYQTVRTAIYTAVLAHEVGHSLGLMHNFSGSEDAINYHDEYWKIRDDGKVAPRLTDPITEAERNARIYDHAYSSVMDYAGRYTIDGRGVGKYDRAAIMFGYAGKVEVFKNRGQVSHENLREWHETDGDVLNFTQQGPTAVHYTSYYRDMGPALFEASNRQLVDVDALSPDFSQATLNGQSLSRVPYLYCSHTRSDISDGCLTRDFGADSMERMSNLLDGINTWYVQRNFVRGQVGVGNHSYVGRYYRRIYDRLKGWHDIYGLYNDLLPRFYQPEQVKQFLSDPEQGWGTKTWAVQNAFNYLVQTLMAPDVGVYNGPYRTASGSEMLLKRGSGPLTLTNADGRHYGTAWGSAGTRECGYFWWECLHHVGFYLDKIMAIEALSDSQTNFVARATPVDIRQWEISYYNTFAEQIAAISAAMMSQDFSRVGPYVDAKGQLRFPNYAGDLSRANKNPVDPAATFSVQLYWQVLGQARFLTNFDRSFVDDAQIFVVGRGDAPELDPDRLYTFADPKTGVTYGALKNGHESAGFAVLRRANRMRAWSKYCDTEGQTPNRDDDCQPIDDNSKAFVTAELLRHLDLVKVMADLAPTMRMGDPYNP